MKTLTMVMRFGDPKALAESMHYTLIGEDYSFERMTGVEIVKAINAKKIAVTNLGVTDKGLVSTNGALKNYTLVDTSGKLVGEAKAVILNRVENEKGLIGYTIYNASGVLQEVLVKDAANMANAGLISNGKIRHTQQGDIVASISGMYPLRTIKMGDAADKSINVDITFMGSAIKGKHNTKYAGVIVNGKNAAAITKLYESLVKANNKLIGTIEESYGAKESASLGIKRTGTAGFYGVYPIEVAFDLFDKAGKKVSFPMGKLMIACTDYDADKSESAVAITPDLKSAGRQEGTEKSDKALKAYAEIVVAKLKELTITK